MACVSIGSWHGSSFVRAFCEREVETRGEAAAKMQSLSESRERSAAQVRVHKAFWEAVAKATAQADVGRE